MKLLWLARLARPDLLKPIGDLATHVQKWSRNDDKKLYRLVCYLNSTKHYKLKGRVKDPLSACRLRLYVDADFCGDKLDTKVYQWRLFGPHWSKHLLPTRLGEPQANGH